MHPDANFAGDRRAASLAAIALVETVTLLNRLLLVGLAHRHLSHTGRPLGPPDVVRVMQFRDALFDARSGLISTAAAALSLGTGAPVGQYGAMV